MKIGYYIFLGFLILSSVVAYMRGSMLGVVILAVLVTAWIFIGIMDTLLENQKKDLE